MMPVITIFITAFLALADVSNAFWRMECRGDTGLARIDPLVEPGRAASHSHIVFGGKNFGFDTTYDDLMASECTSCAAKQDKSAYWTPSLHFQYENGTTVVVPTLGGMLAYYNLFGKNIVAFPKGFRMLAGDSKLRALKGSVEDKPTSAWTDEDRTQDALREKVMSFTCMNYEPGRPAEPSQARHFFPTKEFLDGNCKDGIRAELLFPSCWDGKNLDSEDHKSHLAYPSERIDGVCPPGFDKRVPTLFFETQWNTNLFKQAKGQFIWSNGDTTGFGYHADFLTGWEPGFLQQAINTCTNGSGRVEDCPLFDLQPQAEMQKCKFKVPEALKADNCVGPAKGLCGEVPLQNGPEDVMVAPPSSTPSAIPSIKPPKEASQGPAPTETYATAIPEISTTPRVAGKSSSTTLVAAQSSSTNRVAEQLSSSAVAAVTPSAVAPSNSNIVSVSTYTSAGTVYEVAIEKVEVTVTVEVPEPEATGPAYHRRHGHMHHRRDREHGLLGRRHFTH